MPYIQMNLSTKISDSQKKDIYQKVSEILVDVAGKNKNEIMVQINENAYIAISDACDLVAYILVNTMTPLSDEISKEVTLQLCRFLKEYLNFDTKKLYINYGVSTQWGWNTKNF